MYLDVFLIFYHILQGIIKGGKGVTKTWSVQVIMWQLTGQKPEDKLDPGARDSTVKRLAAYYSTPTAIEDNASKTKVGFLLFQ